MKQYDTAKRSKRFFQPLLDKQPKMRQTSCSSYYINNTQFNIMKLFIAIATFATAAVSGAYASNSPQRKRTIENKYATSNVIVEEKETDVVYLGLSHRNLEKDSSMSMDHGEYGCI